MRRRDFFKIAGASAALGAVPSSPAGMAAAAASEAAGAATFVSGREDGRFIQTAGFLHAYLKALEPQLAFADAITLEGFGEWQDKVRQKLLELMCFPDVAPQPEPERIWSRPRDGYVLERWEIYPEPFSVVPVYLLIPDGASQQSPVPMVMCFPGSTHSKEMLAGEPPLGETEVPDDWKWRDNRMAYHYVQRGMAAVAFDSPATNELDSPLSARNPLSLCGIWMGRSYEAVSVFQKARALEWVEGLPIVDPERIAVSGHSLGAKPADILGVLYPGRVKAVVHNDFVCNWQERAVALNLEVPGNHQIVPGIFLWFDYTDIEAALAPMPLLFTEGGRLNQIAKIRRPYALHGAEDAMRVYHYEKYSDPASRLPEDTELPIGISMEEYFRHANVDAAMHRFRPGRAVPWLAEVLGA